MHRWFELYRLTRDEWNLDTRGWDPVRLTAVAALWEERGDTVSGGTGYLARRCYRLAEAYRMKAWITGSVIRGERS